ncbi:Com family DNA-binding transcriptional regulator [Desulfobotulus sp. H1]|uniref:Com family DNA-binding transcriptional regulator n=1 Tax=Desulfobotulus pelophilus TaxID=2823377 RepID=A0ABT3N9A7_9BACT|nr:Com family DNA-binding transcriptional regulator [Desulfobotulus pelophilus]MCW7754039.1 Com family DNA-binding transcriptional regulator [Desulfobotulus pelophilus]
MKTSQDTIAKQEGCGVEGDIRCRRCRRLLMKGLVIKVEVKCPKCGSLQLFGSRPECGMGG